MTSLISGGQIANINQALRPAAFSMAVADGVVQAYPHIYRTQPQVRTVVSFLARNIADLAIHTFRRVGDSDRQREREHPFAQLLGSKPFPGKTPFRWKEAMVSDLCIYDTYLAIKVKVPDADRMGLLRVHPEWVTPEGGTWFAPARYIVKGPKGTITVAADAMFVIRGYNPEDDLQGMPPIESLRQLLLEDYEAARYRTQMWKSGARMTGYIERPADAPKWSDTARERFKADWRGLYTGDGPAAGGTPLLEDGMKFTAQAFTADQAQYVEARKLTREEAAAAYHIPPPFVGILDNATFSNIEEQHRNLYQDTLGPWLTLLTEEFHAQLRPDFLDVEDLYAEFNLDAKLRASFEERAKNLQSAVGGPWMTRNEARAMENMPAVEGGDELVVPLNVVIGGQASPSDSAPKTVLGTVAPQRKSRIVLVKARAPQEQQDALAATMADFFTRQGAAVLSALGAGKPLDEAFDAARWNTELAADLLGVNVDIALAAATQALADLGLEPGDYDAARALAWLTANAEGVAEGVNATTLEALGAADDEDDPGEARKQTFRDAEAVRAPRFAGEHLTAISGFATEEVVRQQDDLVAMKRWDTGGNPRSTHARMDGERVAVGELFSNGARWPGDSKLSPDERAGCNCRLTIEITKES